MKIIRVIVDEVPENCKGCKLLHDMSKTLRENEYLTGTAFRCSITNKLLYYDDCCTTRPDWCPLESYSSGYDTDDPRLHRSAQQRK